MLVYVGVQVFVSIESSFAISNETSIQLQREFVSVKMFEYSWVVKFRLKVQWKFTEYSSDNKGFFAFLYTTTVTFTSKYFRTRVNL